ncbi:MAG: phage integrase SAM-like domain-containing protein [Reichenbachiella sp.]|uniref:site-specific integrase n=1 Tax=Reichenbachiella sp. TaxID=2184521 RepID=UPI003264818D
MPTVKAIIRKNKVNLKGECVVYIRYGHMEKSVDISTGIRIEPKFWNDDKQKINSILGLRKSKSNEDLLKEKEKSDLYANSGIDKIKSELIGIARLLQHDDIEPETHLVKEKFLDKKKPKTKLKIEDNLFTLFSEFVDNSSKSDTTKRNYRTVEYHLKEFQKFKKRRLALKDFDIKFYDQFKQFLFNDLTKPDGTKGLSDNSATSTIKNLKVFLTYLEKRGYDFQHIIPHLKATYQDTPIYFLTEEDIVTLYEHVFESKKLEKVRDIFILNCYLGLRYSDLSRLTKDHIVNDVVELRAYKTLKDIYVPLTPIAKDILRKYDYELPMMSEQKMNEYIKEACKQAKIDQKVEKISTSSGNKTYKQIPKYEVITTHIAVKTFISLCCKKNISPKTVSIITGKTVKVIMKHYLGMDKSTVKDQMIKAFA